MPKPDLTYRAVSRQLQGMNAETYEISVLDAVADCMVPRTLTPAQIIESLSWLKRENAAGRHIFIRPQSSSDKCQGLILVDDLTQGSLKRMQVDGFAPAVETETSPYNFQAWVRVSVEPIPHNVASRCARLLAQRYDGDPGAASYRQYGRLAGFTNRKPDYIQSGGTYPFVKLHMYNGKLAENAPHLLQEAHNSLLATQTTKTTKGPSQGQISVSQATLADPLSFYQRQLQGLMQRYGTDLDVSRADWMIAISMAKNGFSRDAIAEALDQESPHLEERKKTPEHAAYYITHTLDKVMQLPEVIAAMQAHQVSGERE